MPLSRALICAVNYTNKVEGDYMHQLYETIPSSDFKQNPAAAFKRAEDAPVVVMSRATPAAVMVSPEQWNATAKRLAYLERILAGDKANADMDAGNFDTVEQVEEFLS